MQNITIIVQNNDSNNNNSIYNILLFIIIALYFVWCIFFIRCVRRECSNNDSHQNIVYSIQIIQH